MRRPSDGLVRRPRAAAAAVVVGGGGLGAGGGGGGGGDGGGGAVARTIVTIGVCPPSLLSSPPLSATLTPTLPSSVL